mgnify:CR=1 FL=1
MRWRILPFALGGIICLAAALRLAGIQYGLPLRLIADEPQFVLTALLMAQEPTVALPRTLPGFTDLLYSPPYLAYLFLPGSLFLRYVAQVDTLVPYFVAARLMAIAAGLLAIWFVVRIARRLFPDDRNAGLFAAYFFATSILAIAASASARHWPFAMLLGTAGGAVLALPRLPFSTRYLLVAVVAGIAMGVNQPIAALLVIAAAWYFLIEQGTLKGFLSAWWLYAGIGLFGVLTALLFFLYPESLRGIMKESREYAFTAGDLLHAPIRFFAPFIKSEPVLFFSALAGLGILWRRQRKVCWLFAGTIFGYMLLFYSAFQFEHRFLTPLVPVFALLAGVAAARADTPWQRAAIGVILLIPLLASLYFSYLLFRNDSRAQARAWFESNIAEGSRVLVWGALTRLAAMPDSFREKMTLGAAADVEDINEYRYPQIDWGPRYRALNLFDVHTASFYDRIKSYACVRGYDYIIAQGGKENFTSAAEANRIAELVQGGTSLASFGTADARFSVTETRFDGPPWDFFRLKEFGPPIGVYRLDRETLCINEMDILRSILRETASAPQGMFGAHRFTLDKRYNLNIKVTSEKKVAMALFTEQEFERVQDKNQAKPIVLIKTPSAVIQRLDAGRYILLVGSESEDTNYTLEIKVDPLIFDGNG